jgi:hypothetical protein
VEGDKRLVGSGLDVEDDVREGVSAPLVGRRESELLQDEVDLGPATLTQRSGDLRDERDALAGLHAVLLPLCPCVGKRRTRGALSRKLARTRS